MKTVYLISLFTLFLVSCTETEKNNSETESDSINSEEVTLEINDFHHYYTGQIDGQYDIEMYIHANGSNVKGYYSYTKYGKQIQLEGTIDKENKTIEFHEFGDPNTTGSTGKFEGSFNNSFGISGSWSDPTGAKSMSFDLEKQKELFTWYTIDVPFHPYYVNETYSWEGDSGPVDFSNLSIDGLEYMEGELSPIELYEDSTGYTIDLGEEVYVMRDVFFQYSVLAQDGEKFIVETYECGGGTGIFSDIRVLEVSGTILELTDDFAGGDRCTGGLVESYYDKGVVYYSSNITPEDLLMLGGGENSEDYDIQLEWCAMCCIGTADYERNVETKESKLVSVTLDLGYYGTIGDDPALECFYKGLNEYVTNHSMVIPIDDFEQLIQDVLDYCAVPKG